LGRIGESLGAAGQDASVVILDEKVELLDLEAPGPEQCPAERSDRVLIDEDPAGAALHERSTTRKAFGATLALPPPPPHQGAELGLEESLFLPVLYFFFPPRAP
jgi:hypothetical protein